MWSELVTPLTIDSRIWPRTAAIAERFWSPKTVNNTENMKLRLKEISFRLEELGITHIKNRDVILRNLTNNQDISALVDLSKICEPLKIYSRNKGGTEYKSFSPFTLFADACVVDAEDAVGFKKTISYFIEDPNKEHTFSVLSYLKKWSGNYDQFVKISNNPNTKPLESLSQNLSSLSKLLTLIITDKKISENTIDALEGYVKNMSDPIVDVEVAIIKPLNQLIFFCKTNYYSK
jgi:hexosaminidase